MIERLLDTIADPSNRILNFTLYGRKEHDTFLFAFMHFGHLKQKLGI